MKTSNHHPRSIIIFFVLSFSLAWTIWITLGMYAPEKYFYIIIGALAPTLAALFVLGIKRGKTGIRLLLSKLLIWRVKSKYYLFSIFFPVFLVIIATIAHRLIFGGEWFKLNTLNEAYGLPSENTFIFFLYAPLIFLATVIGGPLAEELGWRGVAQPQLAKIIGVGKSGLIIGLIWSFWHLPLFYFFPKAVTGIPLGYYPFILTSFSIFFSWLSHHTKGSVLLAILLHTGMNFALGIFNTLNAEENNSLLPIFTLISVVTALLFGAKLWNLKPEGLPDEFE